MIKLKLNELKSEMARNEITQKELAKKINKNEITFCRNLKSGYLSIEDAEKISYVLNLSLERRAEIFLS